MPSISGPSMTSIGPAAARADLGPQLLGVGLDELVDALHQRVGDPLPHRQRPPLLGGRLLDRAVAGEVGGDLEQPLGAVGTAVEDHVLDALAQQRVHLVVDLEGAGVDDAHVHAGGDRVEQEHGVDRLAHGVVPAEGERHVRDAAGHQRAGQVLLDPARRLDEVEAVVRVLLDARGDGEDVRVEDDVLGREADLLGQDVVGAAADLGPALEGVGLPLLVEGHDDDGGAVLAAQARLADELLLALLHGDRVDDRLALDALEAGLDDVPLGGVDHHGDAGDVGLGGDQLGEAVHRLDAVDHPFVHVDVDDLCAGLDLLAGDGERGRVVAGLDQVPEAGRAGDVGALADVDEQAVLGDGQRLQPREAEGGRHLGGDPRSLAVGCGGDPRDVLRRRPAAAADQVDEAAVDELLEDRGGLLGRLVVLAERVGQPGIRIAGDERVGDAGDLGDVGPHLLRPEGAVEADQERAGVPHRVPERLGDLPGERAPGRVGDRAGDHDRPAAAPLLEQRLQREDRRLGVQRVEDRLDQQHVRAAVDQAARPGCGRPRRARRR